MVLDYGGAQRIQRLSTFTTDKFQIKLPPQSVADLGVSEDLNLQTWSPIHAHLSTLTNLFCLSIRCVLQLNHWLTNICLFIIINLIHYTAGTRRSNMADAKTFLSQPV